MNDDTKENLETLRRILERDDILERARLSVFALRIILRILEAHLHWHQSVEESENE